MNATALLSFPVGVLVERHKAISPWLDEDDPRWSREYPRVPIFSPQ